MNTRANLLESLDSLLTRVSKEAEAYTEPGSYVSGTTHPVKDVDDGTQKATSGARTTENEKDVKDAPNRGRVVDKAPESASNQDDYQTDIGITSKETGDDPSSETAHVKDTKQDSGYESDTSHEAKADNKSLDGKKYASAGEEFWAFAKAAEELGKDICATIATRVQKAAEGGTDSGSHKVDPSAAGSTNSHAGGVDKGTDKPGRIEAKDEHGNNPSKQAEAAGYDLAGLFANLNLPVEEKRAADIAVVEQIAEVLKLAEDRANKAAEFYFARAQATKERAEQLAHEQKQAALRTVASRVRKQANMDPAMMAAGGGAPMDPATAGGAGGGEEIDPAMLEALMGGGAGGGAPGAADPVAGAGGEEAAMGGGGEEDEAAMLEAVLQELGISPEELMAAVEGGEAGAGGLEEDPAAAGAAGEAGAPPAEELKTASWRPKTAADKRAYSEMKAYVTELVGRGRARRRR